MKNLFTDPSAQFLLGFLVNYKNSNTHGGMITNWFTLNNWVNKVK